LTFGLTLVPAGRLGDAFGRRRMFLVALPAFVLTSALTGAAPTTELLIAARLLLGVAGGMLIPQNSGLIQDLFRGSERARAFGLLGATVGLSTAAGPVIGGLLLAVFTGADGWRWVFYVNVPIGLVALVLAARFLPSTTGARPRRTHVDLVGALLLGGGVVSLLLPLVDAESGRQAGLWPLFALAIALLCGFGWWEVRTGRQRRQPLIDPRLAGIPGYAAGSGIGLVYYTGFTGVGLVLALFLQDGLGYSPLRSGLAVSPAALGVAVSSVIAGRLVLRVGRWLTVAGLAASAVGLVATALVLRHVGGDAAAWAIAAPLLLVGIGGGMVTSPNITLTLQFVPLTMAGVAGGSLQTAQRIGAAIGVAVLATVYYQVLSAGEDYPTAVSRALLCGSGIMLLALLMALAELTRRIPARNNTPDPAGQAQHNLHHI
jgi:MFS family permease